MLSKAFLKNEAINGTLGKPFSSSALLCLIYF